MKPFAQRKASAALFFIILTIFYGTSLFLLMSKAIAARHVPEWLPVLAPMFWTITAGIPFACAMTCWATRRFRGAFGTLLLLTAYAALLSSSIGAPLRAFPLVWWVAAFSILALLLGVQLRRHAAKNARISVIRDARSTPPPIPDAQQRLLTLLQDQLAAAKSKISVLQSEMAAVKRQVGTSELVLHQCVHKERVLKLVMRDHLMLVHGLRGEDLEVAVLRIQRNADAAFKSALEDCVKYSSVWSQLFPKSTLAEPSFVFQKSGAVGPAHVEGH